MKIRLIGIPMVIGPLLMLFVCVTGCGTRANYIHLSRMDAVLFLMELPANRCSGVTIAWFMIMPTGRVEPGKSGGMRIGN